jgi:ZIP family zinc transporter
VLAALCWGLLAASSLIVGAALGVIRDWNQRVVGLLLGFGAGALVASVSFELAEEGFRVGGAVSVSLGLAVGAVTLFLADMGVARLGGRARQSAGSSLALGALLDGIPEQAVLGIGIATGPGVSLALLVAIFVSNLPEAIGSASDIRTAGHPPRTVLLLWTAVAKLCALATVGGFQLQEVAGKELQGTPTDSRPVRCWSCWSDR